MRISDWSSDVCSSDLGVAAAGRDSTLDRRRWRRAVIEAAPPAPPVDIPYGFARVHGVVIAADGEGRWLATLREGADPAVLIEVKRYLAAPLRVTTAGVPDFDRLLSDHYEIGRASCRGRVGH